MSIEDRREINRLNQSKVRKANPKPHSISRDPVTGKYRTEINNGIEYKKKLYTANTQPKAVNGDTLEGEHATKIDRKRGVEGYLDGQIFNNPIEEETREPIKKIKYCFYVTENGRRNLYIGGHVKKPILIKSLDPGWDFQLQRSRIDNLGGKRYIIFYEYYQLTDPRSSLTLECRSTEKDHNWSINYASLGRFNTLTGDINTVYYYRRYGFISLQGGEYSSINDPFSGIYKGEILTPQPINRGDTTIDWNIYLTPYYTYTCMAALSGGQTDLIMSMMINSDGLNAIGARSWNDSIQARDDTVAFYGNSTYVTIEDNFLFILGFYLVRNADLITSFIKNKVYQLKTYDYRFKIKRVNSPTEKGFVYNYTLNGSEVIREPNFELAVDWYTVNKNVTAWDMSYHP